MNVHKSSYSPNCFFCATYSLFDAILVYSTIDRTLEHRSNSSVPGDSSILASRDSYSIAADSFAYYSTL